MAKESDEGVFYITANEAVEYLAQHVGGKYQARSLIIDAMHSGDLITTADTMWVIEDADPTDPWDEIIKDASVFATDFGLPADYWHGSYQWPSETRHWRWREGNFLLNRSETPMDPFTGDALGNVQFEEAQVERLVGKSSRAGIGGRKFDKEKWAEFWLNIIYTSGREQKDWSKFPSRNALKNYMLQECNDGEFADSTIAFAVEMAWEKLVERTLRDREVWGDP
jgi:hypothetical protein